MSTVRLRGNAPRRSGPYPLGTIPNSVVHGVGKGIVALLATGRRDLAGDDFGDIFASAINGVHRGSPLGIADVELGTCAWSVKTVKATRPFSASVVRLISGRNAPVYSQELSDPFADIQETGNAVLEIWNARVNEAYAARFRDLRILLLIRNVESLEFVLTEHEAHRYPVSSFAWELNNSKNFVGRDRSNGLHRFTWQPSGGQFTIHHEMPASVRKFRILKRPAAPRIEDILKSIGFDDSWIETL